MNIQQFQYVLAVADSKNFEEAAEKCFITQSTLSTMINKLEREISIKIFNRKTKPVTITQEGSLIISRLRVINNEIDALGNVIQEIKGEMVGDLKIGVIPTIAPYLLPLFINEFAQQFPKVNIQIKELTTEQIQENLLLRNLDIGILALSLAHKELLEFPIYNEPFLVYDCTGDKLKDKLSPEDLNYSKICLLEDGHCLREQAFGFCFSAGAREDERFKATSMDTLLHMVATGAGTTLIPALASKNRVPGVVYLPFTDPQPTREIVMLMRSHSARKPALEAIAESISSAYATEE